MLPLQKFITDHGLSYALYADDNQLYIVFNCPKQYLTNIALRYAISDTHHWLTMNFQNINDGKTGMILISSMHLTPMELPPFLVGG